MKPKPNPELVDGDNPEWTELDFQRAVTFSQLPVGMQQKLRGKHRLAIGTEAQERIAVPIAADLVETFRAGGGDWEGRINAALAEWLAAHSAGKTAG